ncbi:hypothetical protein DAMA08_014390 [Martiniozyma asiatica (nom. inval.)]|nr:hypothetical protein DAMA08_014390 [Martiniozyma asiatica]
MSAWKTFFVSLFVCFSVLNIYQANFTTRKYPKSVSSADLPQEVYVHRTTPPPVKNPYSLTTIEARLGYYFPYLKDDPVEKNIFQLWKTSDLDDPTLFKPEWEDLIDRWKKANGDHDLMLYSIQEAENNVVDFLRPTVPEVVDALRLLPHDRLKFEFLKFLIIYLNGGVYADVDTINIKPIRFWFNSPMSPTKFWLGVDTDYNAADWSDHYLRRLTFSTDIFRSKAHHPMLGKLIARITYIIFTQKDLIKSIDWDNAYEVTDASGNPTIQFTGEFILTDTTFEYINTLPDSVLFTSASNDDLSLTGLSKKIYGPDVKDQKFSYKKFTLLSNPVQINDLAILPKVSFNGYESEERDKFDDDGTRSGWEGFYYARSKKLTGWSLKELKAISN